MKHILRTMFAKFALPAIATFALAAALQGAPLTSDTPVHSKPELTADTIATLAAGVEPTPATSSATMALPEGWQAIEIAGTHDVWVRDNDLNKELDVKPGSSFRLAPQADAPVFATMAQGDDASMIGLKGRWVQISLTKKVTGYIYTGSAPVVASTPPPTTVAPQTPPPQNVTPQPPPQAQQPRSGPQQPPATYSSSPASGQSVAPNDGGAAVLPRYFEGTFASTRRAFAPRRPYEYQLTDAGGTRYAYLDLSKLLLTEQLENFVGRVVVVYGTANAVPDTKDIVIRVETLQMR